MRAVVFAAPDQVRVQEVSDPGPPAPLSAIVKVTTAAICGTDLHVVRGDFAGVTPGMVIGHEFVGHVVAVGTGVQRLAVGDFVMSSDFTACGRCRWCDRHEHWHCDERAFFGTGTAFGPALPGAQAEFVVVPHADTTLATIPAGCSPEVAILIGDNLATAWSALRRARFVPGESVAIIGGGPIGQLVALCALSAAAGSVVVIEPNSARRHFAEEHGAFSVAPDDALRFVRSVTQGDGADIVVEAVGANATLDAALTVVRRAGRIVSVGAHSADHWQFPVSASFSAESSLSFVIGDSIRTRDQLASMVAGGAIDPSVVIDARVSLDGAPEAYAALRAQQRMKILIDVS
jgi:alcohol dehydrogenase